MKDGTGTLLMTAEQQSTGFKGAIALNGGTLELDNRTTGSTGASNSGGFYNGSGAIGNTVYMNGYNSTLILHAEKNGSFNENVYLAVNNPTATITVGRITSGTGDDILNGSLTFGGSPGDQGQTLFVTNANSRTLRVNGNVILGAGNEIINSAVTTTLLELTRDEGVLSGHSGTLVKENTGTLFVGLSATAPTASPTAWTGRVDVLAGALDFNAKGTANATVTNNTLGSSTITMVGGTLNA